MAQLGATFSLDSDYRARNYSLTDGDPAATAQLTYDHPSGAYFDVTALTKLGGGSPRFLGVLANAGYARRLSSAVTVDVGVFRSQIRAPGPYRPDYRYTDVYAGASLGRVTGRIHYSPDYRHPGVSAVYTELESGFAPADKWRVSGHVGSLFYVDTGDYYYSRSSYQDWRIGVARQFGRVEVHSAVSGGGPGEYRHGYRTPAKTVITAGASVSF